MSVPRGRSVLQNLAASQNEFREFAHSLARVLEIESADSLSLRKLTDLVSLNIEQLVKEDQETHSELSVLSHMMRKACLSSVDLEDAIFFFEEFATKLEALAKRREGLEDQESSERGWKELEGRWLLSRKGRESASFAGRSGDEEQAIALMQKLIEDRDKAAQSAMRAQARAEAELELEQELATERARIIDSLVEAQKRQEDQLGALISKLEEVDRIREEQASMIQGNPEEEIERVTRDLKLAHLEEIRSLNLRYEEEINKIDQKNEEILKKIAQKHQDDLDIFEQKHQEELTRIAEENEEELTLLRQASEEEFERLKLSKEEELSSVKRAKEEEIAKIKQESFEELEKLQRNHREAIALIKAELAEKSEENIKLQKQLIEKSSAAEAASQLSIYRREIEEENRISISKNREGRHTDREDFRSVYAKLEEKNEEIKNLLCYKEKCAHLKDELVKVTREKELLKEEFLGFHTELRKVREKANSLNQLNEELCDEKAQYSARVMVLERALSQTRFSNRHTLNSSDEARSFLLKSNREPNSAVCPKKVKSKILPDSFF